MYIIIGKFANLSHSLRNNDKTNDKNYIFIR